jgi:hypothetical protein
LLAVSYLLAWFCDCLSCPDFSIAGDTLDLQCNGATVNFPQLIVITKSVTINANNGTFDGQGTTRFFAVGPRAGIMTREIEIERFFEGEGKASCWKWEWRFYFVHLLFVCNGGCLSFFHLSGGLLFSSHSLDWGVYDATGISFVVRNVVFQNGFADGYGLLGERALVGGGWGVQIKDAGGNVIYWPIRAGMKENFSFLPFCLSVFLPF